MDIKSKAEHAVERLPPKSQMRLEEHVDWQRKSDEKAAAMGIAKGDLPRINRKSATAMVVDQTAAAPAPAGNQRTQHAQNAWQRLCKDRISVEQCESPVLSSGRAYWSSHGEHLFLQKNHTKSQAAED